MSNLDLGLAWELFARFVACDTSVRAGELRIPAVDVAVFAHDVAAPTFEELGAEVRVDRLNNVVARFGEERGTELLFVAYPALHHGNEMADPLRARREDGRWIGLGASQSKAALAAVCTAVHALREQGVELAGRVTLAVSSEGRSSHASAEVLYAGFERLPAGGVLVVGTENRITLGNRGRVDVEIQIDGRPTHSSSPESGLNPIPVSAEVLRRVAELPLDRTPHEQLGARELLAYKLVCGPVAPHTIPARCELVLDRRLLPGDDAGAVVTEIAAALADLPVRVARGPTMLPALVDPSARVVVALQEGARRGLGRELETVYPRGTFDAGYPCSLGVPTVMFGPSAGDLGGAGVLDDDWVLEQDVRDAAAIYAGAIASG